MIASILAVLALAYFGPLGPASPYKRFHGNDAIYYSKLADACNLLLETHTNFNRYTSSSGNFYHAWMDQNGVLWEQIRIAPNDPMLPERIRRLHPDEVLVERDRVVIAFGVGRLAWGVAWKPDDLHSNRWVLVTNGDGLERPVYHRD